jgi:RNA polymerase sigma factor (sigma-70 family)
MVRLAALLLGSRSGAEDLVQDAFAHLFMRYESIMEPEAYIRRIIVNSARTRRRLDARHQLVADVPDEVGTSHAEPVEMWDLIERLPDREYMAVVLRYGGGLTEKEVAKEMGCSKGTASSLLSRAVAALRKERIK